MELLHIILLAIIQGITEFIPVSSSAHLIILPNILNWQDQGLLIDIALHSGSLGAILVYFRHETLQIVQGALHCLIMRPQTQQARLFLTLCVATFPVILFGFMFSTFHWGEHVRSIAVIGWTTVIYAVILYIADRWGARAYSVSDYRVHDAILMGFAQVLALIPGTSRSGIVFTAARLLGYERVASAQLALLMGIPTLLASTTQGAMELAHSSDVMITKTAILAASLSFIFALITLRVFMRIISKFAITGFVIYRLFLGGWLLWIVYGPPL